MHERPMIVPITLLDEKRAGPRGEASAPAHGMGALINDLLVLLGQH